MKKVLILTILLVLLLTAGCFYWTKYHVSPVSVVKDNFSIIKDVALENEKANWLTYTNDIVGYSFKHPSELEIDTGVGDLGDRTVYFRSQKGSSSANVRFVVACQDEFDEQKVFVNSQTSFKKEVSRRMVNLFSEKDKVVSHETTFIGKPAIAVERNNMIAEIFVWYGNQILQIEIFNLKFTSSDLLLLSKILSTFTFFN